MLPIFRIISVGGVTLAIAILILALIPPGGTHLVLAQHDVVARGALIDSSRHPEWRQFLLHAALLRAGELERLRDLPEAVIRQPDSAIAEPRKLDEALAEPAAPQLAGLPMAAVDAELDDVTGSIGDNPGATLPIDIGEASSTELPVTATEQGPPAIRLPALQTPAENSLPSPPVRPAIVVETEKKPEARRRVVQQRPRRKTTPPAPEPIAVPPPFNILAAIFGSLANAESAKQASPPVKTTAASPPVRRQALSTRAVTQ